MVADIQLFQFAAKASPVGADIVYGADSSNSFIQSKFTLSSILPAAIGALTNGQLLIGNTSTGTYSTSTLTAGSGISITNGTGSISIAATGVSGLAAGGVLFGGAGGGIAQDTTHFYYNAGQLGLGSNSISGYTTFYIFASNAYGEYITGNSGALDPSGFQAGSSVAIGFNTSANPTFSASYIGASFFLPPSGKTIAKASQFYGITYSNGGSGTVTSAYTGYFELPTAGSTSNAAVYAANLSVGYPSNSPGANNLIVSGKAVIGSATFSGSELLRVTSAGSTTVLIDGSGDVFPQIHIQRTGASTYTNRDWAVFIASNGSFDIKDVTAGADRVLIDTSGNVGIGTAPLNKLDVPGRVAIGSYAGVNTAPSNSLIVSGGIAVGQTTLTGGVTVEVSGVIASQVQLGFAWLGDIATARCFSTLGGTKLAFYSDNSTASALAFATQSKFSATWYNGWFLDLQTLGMGIAGPVSIGQGGTISGTALTVGGKTATTNFQMTASPAAGYFLQSDGSGNGSWQPCGSGGSNVYTVTRTATDYAITLTDTEINVTAVAAPFRSIALPYTNGIPYAQPPMGKIYLVKDTSGAAATHNIQVTVSLPGGGNIENGATTYTITTNFGWVMFSYDSTADVWYIIGHS